MSFRANTHRWCLYIKKMLKEQREGVEFRSVFTMTFTAFCQLLLLLMFLNQFQCVVLRQMRFEMASGEF